MSGTTALALAAAATGGVGGGLGLGQWASWALSWGAREALFRCPACSCEPVLHCPAQEPVYTSESSGVCEGPALQCEPVLVECEPEECERIPGIQLAVGASGSLAFGRACFAAGRATGGGKKQKELVKAKAIQKVEEGEDAVQWEAEEREARLADARRRARAIRF